MTLRIGVLTTSFPRFDGDVSGPFVLRMAEALARRGHRVEVLAPDAVIGRPPRFNGVTVSWVPYLRPRALQRTFYETGALDRAQTDPSAWPGLLTYPPALTAAAAWRRQRWDALISHWALPCALAAGAVRGRRPHLAVFHSGDVWALRQLPAWVTRGAVRGATATWFVTAKAAEEITHRSGVTRPSLIAPMAADAPRKSATPKRFIAPDKPIKVLFLGRLVPIKGADVAVIAAAKSRGAISLFIAGSGPERQRLEAQSSKNVTFLGTVDRIKRGELFQAADVVVIPSRRLPNGREEGVPTVAMEAAAHGIPVVATDTGGLATLGRWVRHVPPDDAGALLSELMLLRQDFALRQRLRDEGLRFARGHGWAMRAEQVEGLLRA